MKRRPTTCLLIVSLFCMVQVFAQDRSPARFGRVSSGDFSQTIYEIDSNASAVVIADIGSTEIEGNNKGSFSLVFKNYRRACILNKNGYGIAEVRISLYTNGSAEEELLNLKAVTYNLENGRVVETKLDTRTSVFSEKADKNRIVKKFTFPDIKEGSIIEFQYSIRSDFVFNLQPWEFQGSYPRLWSEYAVSIPEFYYYVTLSQGYQPYYIKEQKSRVGSFVHADAGGAGATDRTPFDAMVTDFRWVMRNVPALKEESFTSTLSNHIARIEFQLAELRQPYTPQNIMGTWEQACEDLLKDEDFGYALSRDNPWLNDVMFTATRGAAQPLQRAKNIYEYIRDNMTCTGYNSTQLAQPLRNVLKNRSGTEAEINLLLVAMLRKAGLEAEPVLLSTRSHGYTYPMYPLMSRFNYVIVRTTIDGKEYYLDASEPRMGFGKLAYDCYNGHARVVNAEATPVQFIPDSLLERSTTSVFIMNNGKGDFEGSVQHLAGYYESGRIRHSVKEKGQEELTGDIKRSFNTEAEIRNIGIDSLDKYDEPVSVHYDFDMKQEKGDIIYLNPMFGEGYRENPFKSAVRYYPVEMPYTIDQTYLLQMGVPDGYETDELPRQVMVKLNEDDDGLFEYRITESGGTISLRSRLRINRTYFQPEEYSMLREFFSLVVKKHNEQIVFKKKK